MCMCMCMCMGMGMGMGMCMYGLYRYAEQTEGIRFRETPRDHARDVSWLFLQALLLSRRSPVTSRA